MKFQLQHKKLLSQALPFYQPRKFFDKKNKDGHRATARVQELLVFIDRKQSLNQLIYQLDI